MQGLDSHPKRSAEPAFSPAKAALPVDPGLGSGQIHPAAHAQLPTLSIGGRSHCEVIGLDSSLITAQIAHIVDPGFGSGQPSHAISRAVLLTTGLVRPHKEMPDPNAPHGLAMAAHPVDPGLGSGPAHAPSFTAAATPQATAGETGLLDSTLDLKQLHTEVANLEHPTSTAPAASLNDLGLGSGQHPQDIVTTVSDPALGSLSSSGINGGTQESPQSMVTHIANFSASSQDLGLGSERTPPTLVGTVEAMSLPFRDVEAEPSHGDSKLGDATGQVTGMSAVSEQERCAAGYGVSERPPRHVDHKHPVGLGRSLEDLGFGSESVNMPQVGWERHLAMMPSETRLDVEDEVATQTAAAAPTAIATQQPQEASLGIGQTRLQSRQHAVILETTRGERPLNPLLPWPRFEPTWDVPGKSMLPQCDQELPPTQKFKVSLGRTETLPYNSDGMGGHTVLDTSNEATSHASTSVTRLRSPGKRTLAPLKQWPSGGLNGGTRHADPSTPKMHLDSSIEMAHDSPTIRGLSYMATDRESDYQSTQLACKCKEVHDLDRLGWWLHVHNRGWLSIPWPQVAGRTLRQEREILGLMSIDTTLYGIRVVSALGCMHATWNYKFPHTVCDCAAIYVYPRHQVHQGSTACLGSSVGALHVCQRQYISEEVRQPVASAQPSSTLAATDSGNVHAASNLHDHDDTAFSQRQETSISSVIHEPNDPGVMLMHCTVFFAFGAGWKCVRKCPNVSIQQVLEEEWGLIPDRFYVSVNGRPVSMQMCIDSVPACVPVRVHTRLRGGAGLAVKKLRELLVSKGVPETEISNRIAEVIASVGESAISEAFATFDPWQALKAKCQGKVRLVKQNEARAPKTKRQEDDEDILQIQDPWAEALQSRQLRPDATFFQTSAKVPPTILQSVSHGCSGLAMVDEQEAVLLSRTDADLSPDELAVITVGEPVLEGCKRPTRVIEFPCEDHKGAKLLIKGTIVDLGAQKLQVAGEDTIHSIDVVSSACVSIEVHRSEYEDWQEFQQAPVRHLKRVFSLKTEDVLHTWGKRAFRQGKQAPNMDQAESIFLMLRVRTVCLEPILKVVTPGLSRVARIHALKSYGAVTNKQATCVSLHPQTQNAWVWCDRVQDAG